MSRDVCCAAHAESRRGILSGLGFTANYCIWLAFWDKYQLSIGSSSECQLSLAFSEPSVTLDFNAQETALQMRTTGVLIDTCSGGASTCAMKILMSVAVRPTKNCICHNDIVKRKWMIDFPRRKTVVS